MNFARFETPFLLKTSRWLLANIRLGEDALKTSSRGLEDVFSVTFFCLHFFSLTSSRHNCKASSVDVLKTSWKMSQNILKMSWRRHAKTSWRLLQDVFKTFLEDILQTHQDFKTFKRSWKRKNCCTEDVLKTSWKTRNVCSAKEKMETVCNKSKNTRKKSFTIYFKSSHPFTIQKCLYISFLCFLWYIENTTSNNAIPQSQWGFACFKKIFLFFGLNIYIYIYIDR